MSDQVITRAGCCLPGRPAGVAAALGFSAVQNALEQRARAQAAVDEHVIVERTPVSNQGRAGSCVCNALPDAFEILLGLDNPGSVRQLSRRFLYWASRELDGLETMDEGTHIASAAHQLTYVGVCEEQYFPYSDTQEMIVGAEAKPHLSHYTMASANKLAAYYWIESEGQQRVVDVETCVRADHPVVFGTPVSQAFCDYRRAGAQPARPVGLGGSARDDRGGRTAGRRTPTVPVAQQLERRLGRPGPRMGGRELHRVQRNRRAVRVHEHAERFVAMGQAGG
jgi:hypothetical protein